MVSMLVTCREQELIVFVCNITFSIGFTEVTHSFMPDRYDYMVGVFTRDYCSPGAVLLRIDESA